MSTARSPSSLDAPGIAKFTLGPYATNCYVVTPSRTGDGTADSPVACWIVDASFSPGQMINFILDRHLRPQALILTHAHVDHIAGAEDILRVFNDVPIWIHSAEREWLGNPVLNLSEPFGQSITCRGASRLMEDGEVLTLGGDRWRILHTPGHSPGGITLWHEESKQAIVGDSLFAGSIGRTDFPGSDAARLTRSIRERLYLLPDDTVVHPGHGDSTTIGREKRGNPFVRG